MVALHSIQRSERRYLDIVLVALRGSEQENREFATRHAIQKEKYVLSNELGDLYNVASSPYGVLIGADGTVRSKGIVNHLEHFASLLNADEIGQPTMEKFLLSRQGNPGEWKRSFVSSQQGGDEPKSACQWRPAKWIESRTSYLIRKQLVF